MLFNGSIFDNVAYGLVGTEFSNCSKDNQTRLVVDACRAAYAHEFIEQLPEVRFGAVRLGSRQSVNFIIGLPHSGRRARNNVIWGAKAENCNRP